MTYKVTSVSTNNISVKLASSQKIKVQTTSSDNNIISRIKPSQKIKVQTITGGIQVPAKFSDLIDYDANGVQDKYVIMYDSATQTYYPVNPDQVLSAAVTDPISPGLPSDFENQLDVDLDNRIDLDAGTF